MTPLASITGMSASAGGGAVRFCIAAFISSNRLALTVALLASSSFVVFGTKSISGTA
jgi:hypothetical protein